MTAPEQMVLRFPPEASHLRVLRRQARDWMRRRGVDQETVESMVLALDEIVSNAIEHGEAYRRAFLPLAVALHQDGQGVVLEFEDPEAPADLVRELGVALARSAGNRPPPDSERGRGLFLVGQMLSDLSVTPAAGGGLHLRGRCGCRTG
jgi:anti-sigma regulatory factor (Ser/Thr protein kinase)